MLCLDGQTERPLPHAPSEAFSIHVFSAKAVRDGRIVRRALREIERYIGHERFLKDVRGRGFRAVENAGQIVNFCNREPVRVLRDTVFAGRNGSEEPAIPLTLTAASRAT
jgi:hypothetical protein